MSSPTVIAAASRGPNLPHTARGVVEATRGPALEFGDARARERASRAARARRASGRRRLVDPTTCEREYSVAEIEFFRAIEAYKARSGRPFPTWGEVLALARDLGYERAVVGMAPAC